MSSEELATLEVPPKCEHGYADPAGCDECFPSVPSTETRQLESLRMRLPGHLATATLDNWRPECPAPIREYVASWPPAKPMLWLGGNIGTGKSHLAVGIIRGVRGRYGVTGQFWPVTEVVDSYRAAASPEYEGPWNATALTAALTGAPLLVLDDLGAEYGTEFSAARLFAVVDHRYRERLPTVVTTNVAAGAIDPRLRSRLLSGEEVRFTGPDRRMA